MTKGKFICFEGIDFSGKSTQVKRTLDYIRGLGLPVTTARDPGTTSLGEVLRLILKEPENVYKLFNVSFQDYKGFPEHGLDLSQRRTAVAETLLYTATRAELVKHVIRPVLDQGGHFVADRFTMSTRAYQGAGRYKIANQGLEPDLTLLLDIPFEVMQARAPKEKDYLESEVKDFWDRVIDRYRAIAEEDERIITIDGTLPQDVVFNDHIKPAIDSLLKINSNR